jgi:hypothetical protein
MRHPHVGVDVALEWWWNLLASGQTEHAKDLHQHLTPDLPGGEQTTSAAAH